MKNRGIAILLFWVLPFLSVAKSWYVAPSGNNNGNGSRIEPFQTVMFAIEQMQAGDTCILREGIYREKVTLGKDGITLCAFANEPVCITGCDMVHGEGENFINKSNQASCHRLKFDKKVFQLFLNGKRMDIARWPNKKHSMLSMQDWENSIVDAAGDDKKVSIPSIPAQNYSENFWKGGYYIGVNSETPGKLSTWFTGGGKISSSENEILHMGETCYGVGKKYANGNGFGYILNCLNGLDAANEWYWGDGYLYYKMSDDLSDADIELEARTRLNILEITASNIRIEGIDFKAGTVLVEGNGTQIEDCTFRYTSPFVWNIGDDGTESGKLCNWGDYKNGSSGICVLGNRFSMKSCYVAHSWFNGLVLWGDSCTVENCIIEDINWMGKRCSGINSYGADNIIRYCTIRNTGASSIEGGNGNWIGKYAIRNIWEHNRCENACNLVVDQGFFYVNHQNGASPAANSEWRYNYLLNNRGPDKGNWTSTHVGLYVDNSSSGYKIHHNLVINAKEGIRYNDTKEEEKAGRGVYFYNNTFYKVDRFMIYQFWNNQQTALPDAEVIVENNLCIGCGGIGDKNKQKVFGTSNIEFAEKSVVIDIDRLNFSLNPGKLVDSGITIPTIGMEYDGKAPEIGAYEYSTPMWNAGSNLVIPEVFLHDEK